MLTPFRKDSSSGIEEQLSGSNVCAYTTHHFLKAALSKLRTEYNKGNSRQAAGKSLFDALMAMQSEASKYSKYRRLANEDIVELTAHFAKPASKKRKGEPPSPPLNPRKRNGAFIMLGEEGGSEESDSDDAKTSSSLELSDDDSVDAEEEPFLGVMHPLGEGEQADDEEGVYDMEQYNLENCSWGGSPGHVSFSGASSPSHGNDE